VNHVLDNPTWNALTTGNASLANGAGTVRYFSNDVSPFTGLEENTTENLLKLHDQLPFDSPIGFVTETETNIPNAWTVLIKMECFQMVYEKEELPEEVTAPIVQLTEKDIAQMLALTKLTVPGPFAERTIDFGHYTGIFDGEQLIAMAGQRMNPQPYAEISAVCTHPDHLGKGYAKQLLNYQITRIKLAGEIPFLHVRCDNERAIKVYESIGFTKRRVLHFHILQKARATN
jgi:predicted GNAT family acetyltransferase